MAKKAAKKSAKKSLKKGVKKSAKKASRMPMKKVAKKRRKVSSRRELIDTGVDKRYVRRSGDGTFKESDDLSRSLSADARQRSNVDAPKGQGDRGD